MGNLIPYPECNQLPRNLFSCGQSKQAIGIYHLIISTELISFPVSPFNLS
jgi:hypothetical protein